MKKIVLIIISALVLSGCSLTKDSLENAQIYTTTYPITYLMNTLYGEHSIVTSIYPSDADVTNYTLTDKQVKKYADGSIFVYNGLTNEKTVAKRLLNKNKDILIIDVSYGLAIQNSVEELWLSPNNYLMLAKNIRDNLNEYLKNKYIIEDVNNKYKAFSETISIMDADLRSLGKTATKNGKNTLIVTNNAYKFLENYDFNIISLDDEVYKSAEALNTIKKNFKNKKYIALINGNNTESELIIDLINNNGAKSINLSTMKNGDKSEDYISTMQEFIINLRIAING